MSLQYNNLTTFLSNNPIIYRRNHPSAEIEQEYNNNHVVACTID